MDLDAAIRALKADKQRLDELIAAVEKLAEPGSASSISPKRKRGRKGMRQEERQLVSERMRRYWETKKEADRKRVERQSEREQSIADCAGIVQSDIDKDDSRDLQHHASTTV